MKKLILPIAIGLAIGLGGSTAAVVLMGNEPTLSEQLDEATGHEGADSLAAVDSTAVHGDSLAAHLPDSLAVAVAETMHVDAAAQHAAATAASHTPAIPNTALAGASTPANGMGAAQLAKLFASMQARDAAKVLEHMDDYEVQVILGELGNREAAAILSNLTPERAAIISRSVIRGERNAQ